MSNRDQKLLRRIFETPTLSNIRYADAARLVRSLGGEVLAGSGSRRKFVIEKRILSLHEPHPGKELKKYQVEELRAWFDRLGIGPDEE